MTISFLETYQEFMNRINLFEKKELNFETV